MNTELSIRLFKNLLYIRLVEERIRILYPEQELRCPVHLCIGQESAPVGVCANLLQDDVVFSSHRAHGHYLAKGGDLKKFFAELYGKSTGCCRGKGGSQHLIDTSCSFVGSTPIVAGTIPLAVGAAFSFFLNQKKNIAVAFFGDAATEEGVFHESLNFAKLKNLPVLFVCENNLYAVYTSLKERQPPRKRTDIAHAHGLECYEADGTDVISVYHVAKQALENIRNGNGPAFLEIATYRYFEHCGPDCDLHLGYRSEQELTLWKQKDPLEILKHSMLSQGITTQETMNKMYAEIAVQIDEAVAFGKSSAFPDKPELSQHIYAD
jgi:pyruvate dehydrogenase E1 component alpha subunit